MALVNRTFQRDLVLSASHLKAESVHFEYFGYNEEIDFLIYILNVLVISSLFLKNNKKNNNSKWKSILLCNSNTLYIITILLFHEESKCQ